MLLPPPLQEREFLKNYVQRIVDVRPNLVLVEKTVSRIAQDMLLEHGITLVINVKSVSGTCPIYKVVANVLCRNTEDEEVRCPVIRVVLT